MENSRHREPNNQKHNTEANLDVWNFESDKVDVIGLDNSPESPMLEDEKSRETHLILLEEKFAETQKDIDKLTSDVKDLVQLINGKVSQLKEIRTEMQSIQQMELPDNLQLCSSCATQISVRASSGKCQTCYSRDRDKLRLENRKAKRNAKVSTLRLKVKSIQRKNNRLVLKLKEKEELLRMEFNSGTNVSVVFTNMYKYMNKKKDVFIREIVDSTIRVLTENDTSLATVEVEEFALYIAEQIVNLGRDIGSTAKGKRYSASTLRLAMAIWGRSKTAYDNIRESNIIMFPSSRQLNRTKNGLKVRHGFNTLLYSRLHDEFVRNHTGVVVGHVMMDEMKLKSGVMFHTKTHEVTGFATNGDGIDLDTEVKKLFRDSVVNPNNNKNSEKKEPEVTQYVNQ